MLLIKKRNYENAISILPFSIVRVTLSSMSLFILIAFLILRNEITLQGLLKIIFQCQPLQEIAVI